MIINSKIPVGKDLHVAYTKRCSTSPNAPNLVFLHGFGSSREFFRYAFKNDSLVEYSLISLDLIGFGESSKPSEFSYEISNQAAFMLQVLNQLEISRFHLCAHSMGGLVAMEMINQSPPQILSFINLEGNLTLEDCFGTGKILEYPFDDFLNTGRVDYEKNLLDYPSYLLEFQKASSIALYKSAADTVKLSSDSQLIKDFAELPLKKCYIYGEKNKEKFPAEQILINNGISIYYIADSEHGMAEQNPTHLYSTISKFIESN